MAKIQLTIGNFTVTTEGGTDELTITSDSDSKCYTVSLVDFRFHKKMYQPTEVLANLEISMESGSNNDWETIDRETIETTFKNKRVSLEVLKHDQNLEAEDGDEDDTDEVIDCIGDDFYVQEVRPCYMPDSIIVKLKIYSPDKVMTTQKNCQCWTAKKLFDDILTTEIKTYTKPYNSQETLKFSSENAKVLNYVAKRKTKEKDKDGKETEVTQDVPTDHIFPYLVQYNESFYDMLARTTNRWGLFMFWEDGQLNIGHKFDKDTAIPVTDYHSVTFNDFTLTENLLDSYVKEAPYDGNVLKSMVTEDGASVVANTIANAFDSEKGADAYWLKKVGQVLTNRDSVISFIFNTAVNDLIAWGQAQSLNDQWNKKHNNTYFIDKDKKYISKLDEQYDVDENEKKTLNQFSEATPVVDANKYAKILAREVMSEQKIINIDFDTTWPGLKLGSVIKVKDDYYIVVDMSSDTKVSSSFKIKEESGEKTVVEEKTTSLVFRATAIAIRSYKVKVNVPKTDDSGTTTMVEKEIPVLDDFYPTMIPAGHVRKSGPQMAVVVDVDDPQKVNRVRVMYPWQLTSINSDYTKIKSSDLSDCDVTKASPWLFYAAPSGPKKAGVHGRHYLAEKVLVDYANGNVERPFVMGAFSNETPVKLKTGAALLMAPNGEYVKVHEGSNKGASAFIAGLMPGLNFINSFVDYKDFFGEDGKDNEKSQSFEGGVELGDKYGIWSITGSTDKRAINISSPWGNVSIGAFTGIKISAPNGEIKISGKNVTIEAGNNLTLTSGTNIKNKFASLSRDEDGNFSMATFGNDLLTIAAKKLVNLVAQFIDLSLLRSVVECFWRPQEGCLTIQSNRYLKLSAGGAKPGYPDAAYKKPEKKAKKTIEKSATAMHKNTNGINLLISTKVEAVVNSMITKYRENWVACRVAKTELNTAISNLKDYSDTNDVAEVCNTYEQMITKLWNPSTKTIKEDDLGFKQPCKSDNNDDVQQTSRDRANVNHLPEDMRNEFILKKRKELKKVVVEKANALLKKIATLRTVPMKEGSDTTYQLEPDDTRNISKDIIKDFKKAFSYDNCKDTTFYQYAYNKEQAVNDGRKDLTDGADVNTVMPEASFHRVALMRKVALQLAEKWGMEAQAIRRKLGEDGAVVDMAAAEIAAVPAKPVSEDDLENNNKWSLYTGSLRYTKMGQKQNEIVKSIESAFDNLVGPVTTMLDYYSWGNPKAGEILFGTGRTLSMKKDGTISKLDTRFNEVKLSRDILRNQQQTNYDTDDNTLRNAIMGVGMPPAAP